jgi:hypothetical protein
MAQIPVRQFAPRLLEPSGDRDTAGAGSRRPPVRIKDVELGAAACAGVRDVPSAKRSLEQRAPAAVALRLVGFVDHAEAVAVGVDEDDKVLIRSVLTLVAGRTKTE